MIVLIFIEICLYFYYGSGNQKLCPSSKLRTDSLRDVQVCLQKKRKEFAKWRQN